MKNKFDKETVKLEKHHGIKVFTNTVTEPIRKEQCLCLNCRDMEVCIFAKRFLNICIKDNFAMCITRCAYWVLKEDSNGLAD